MPSAPPGAALLKIRSMTKKSFADNSIRKGVKEVDVTLVNSSQFAGTASSGCVSSSGSGSGSGAG